jgi:cyclophilin family peptidyl-prolyl cis-trans isomerase
MKIHFDTFWVWPAVVLFCMASYSCSIHQKGFLDDGYRIDLIAVSEAAAERNIDKLWMFKGHSDPVISGMAWRALAVSEMEEAGPLVDFALEQDDPRAWYALSFQEMDDAEAEMVSETYLTGESNPDHVCELFYRQGNENTLKMLLSDGGKLIKNNNCSRAVGGIVSRIEIEDEIIGRITDFIFRIDDEVTIKNILYGFWRSAENRPDEFSSAFKMMTEMVYRRTSDPVSIIDEYLVSITGEAGFNAVMHRRPADELYLNVQMAVVTAAALSRFDAEALNQEHLSVLLNHPSKHVLVQTLESLKEVGDLNRGRLAEIGNQIHPYLSNPEVAVTYFELLLQNGIDIHGYLDEIHAIDRENIYLNDRTLGLFRYLYDTDEYLVIIDAKMQAEGIEALHAAQALAEFAESQSSWQPHEAGQIREILLYALERQNRSVLSVSGSLLMDSDLFSEGDLPLFYDTYKLAVQSSNRAAASVLAEVIQHFEGRPAKPLQEMGLKPMRLPDWQTLFEMGEDPRWILETNRGEIVIKLFPMEAPFTVSSIVHLTHEGFYDNVIFHRVVRNFVIQGGDFDRRDGFGSTEYRIPTEPSFQTFKKGMAGIASSGTDTEGSQFFITHTWTPHLDGRYTIFGEVSDGMDIAENIQVGDVVLRARISTR